MAADDTPQAEAYPPGTSWAYRARSKDPLVEVLVVRHGTKRPARILVRFVDADMEGREEWVPPARLKVAWADVDAFRAHEAQWDAVLDLSPRGDTVETEAAHRVYELLVPEEVADLDWRGHYLAAKDVPGLASLSGNAVDELVGHSASFDDPNGGLILPWPVALATARALAERQPDVIAEAVDKDEREFQREAIYGRHYPDRSGGWEVPPERVIAYDGEHDRPVRQMLRAWCGTEAVSRLEELQALRIEIRRVGVIAERAIGALRGHGFVREAEDLMNALGKTVESLRALQSSPGSGG